MWISTVLPLTMKGLNSKASLRLGGILNSYGGKEYNEERSFDKGDFFIRVMNGKLARVKDGAAKEMSNINFIWQARAGSGFESSKVKICIVAIGMSTRTLCTEGCRSCLTAVPDCFPDSLISEG